MKIEIDLEEEMPEWKENKEEDGTITKIPIPDEDLVRLMIQRTETGFSITKEKYKGIIPPKTNLNTIIEILVNIAKPESPIGVFTDMVGQIELKIEDIFRDTYSQNWRKGELRETTPKK